MIEQLVERAVHLPPDDRALIQAVYGDGKNVAEIARLAREDPRSLRRRVRRIVKRLAAPEYAFVVLQASRWSRTRRRVAEVCILHGRSMRTAATELNLSLHTVRRHHDAVRALFDEYRAARRAGSA